MPWALGSSGNSGIVEKNSTYCRLKHFLRAQDDLPSYIRELGNNLSAFKLFVLYALKHLTQSLRLYGKGSVERGNTARLCSLTRM